MGIGTRIFFIDDDDTMHRFPLAKFERLRRGDPKESLPQYAGKRLRYALVVLEMENRRPINIIMVQHSYLYFDFEGRIDTSEREKAATLAVNMVPPSPKERQTGQVINAHHRFAKKEHEHRYSWTPTPEIGESIVAAIFGKDPAMG
jgi:hypothetical protein